MSLTGSSGGRGGAARRRDRRRMRVSDHPDRAWGSGWDEDGRRNVREPFVYTGVWASPEQLQAAQAQ